MALVGVPEEQKEMGMESGVRDNPTRHRFELEVEGGVAFASYHLSDGVLAIFHTGVPLGLRDRGIGSRLAKGVLDEARRRGLKVVPRCSFVRTFINQNPEYQDLV
jgi:uncharacterized protein